MKAWQLVTPVFPNRHVISISLSHPAPSGNVIMQELRKKNVKILSEKVLLLLNRGGKSATSPLHGAFALRLHLL